MRKLIDKDAALSVFVEGDGDDDFTTGYNWAVDEYRQKIADMPTVTAEPKCGHWHYDLPNAIFTCSECHMMYRDNPNYCEECGSMNGGAENG